MRIGYIGLGAMGGALARHLIGKFPLSVFDLNQKAVESFVELGATATATPAELARSSDVILLCLPRSSDVQAALFGPNGVAEGLSAGKIVVDQTSGVPSETRGFARHLEEMDVSLFDAPVSGAMATAIAGTISIIASGPDAAFRKTLPVLQAISPNVFHCGERVGNGQTMKTVNNMMNVSCRLATLEVVAMGRKVGLSLEAMTEAINATTARNYTSQGMLPAIAEGRQSTKFWLALQVKDIHQAIGLAAEQKVPMPIGGAARSILQIGLNSLGKDAQLEQMIGVIESMADTRFVDAPKPAKSQEVK
ncbi:NAD(P)-dependent oxidoreductase [Paraburkholderia hospita]|uniref:NAD(P)-dependent oxidoreductase n=1 Tax=Paraburkholderia hospita TaxID=169430 RepID=UPI000B348584|nr:NAD(P)-dependent oxidoreductase [Paraburkholderia hospita]OUL73702.1 6-phosphogluconate dehydrogenase [Paraburkholderia hospita]